MKLDLEHIKGMEQRYRATFINSLAGFRQAVLIGTKSAEGDSNLAIFNSLIHLGANPALYGFICRPDTVNRHTLSNIINTGVYTLNYVTTLDYQRAHQTSAKYNTGISEFTEVGFTEEYIDGFSAPFVQEAPVKIGMKFEEKIEIKLNGTILVIGSIQSITLGDSIVSEDGFVALEKANVLVSLGLDAYYSTDFIGRMPYARP